ncbi:MAG: hypothetical protein JWO05_724 [Gemmatimonadetes bacterium]|nr:hypothetical protein [Gemmatimonadota bacterium]
MSFRAILLTSLPAVLLLSAPLQAQRPSPRPPAPRPAPAPAAPAAAQPAAPVTTTVLHGYAFDSVRVGPLAGAHILVDGTDAAGIANADGLFRIAGIAPGQHKLIVKHPLLDTLGISLVSEARNFIAGDSLSIEVATPSPETIVSIVCPAARRAMGPASLVGIVRDADSGMPAAGARVSLVWYELDPNGLKKVPRLRESVVTSSGAYRICGLPSTVSGRVQVLLGGVTSGEVTVELNDELLALRSMSIAAPGAAPKQDVTPIAPIAPVAVTPEVTPASPAPGSPATTAPSPATTKPSRPVVATQAGRARAAGRVVNRLGQPLAGARVSLALGSQATITRANGEFTLDSLPSGTQALVARQLGFNPTEVPVELSTRLPAQVVIVMEDFTPALETVRVQASRERALDDVGFTQRRKSGGGYYLDEEAVKARQSVKFTEMLRAVPGIRVQTQGMSGNYITSSRGNSCVNIWVDGVEWKQQAPGDVDEYLNPSEVVAIEAYSGTSTPAEFVAPGAGNCETIVAWTVRRIDRAERTKKKP